MQGRTSVVATVGLFTLVATMGVATAGADALPFLPPGDARLRHLVQLEADEGHIPLSTTWPISTLDLPEAKRTSLYSLEQPGTSADAGWFLSGAAHPTQMRTFDDTPREKGEAGLQAGWAAGDYAGGAIRISYAIKPQDDKKYRFDDTYASWRLGNWWFTLGEQQRWWGPGWDGSLILSNNARPMPSISLDRARSEPFQSRWLHWIGPWRLTAYMARDAYENALWPHPLFWGLRLSFRPFRDVEFGGSRTAQWCRVGVCSLKTFEHVLNGKETSVPSGAATQDPGNQEIEWDVRWHLGSWPAAFYYEQNGETIDPRYPLLPRPRQTTDLVGLEFWSRTKGAGGWRGFLEWAGTTCGEFSFVSSDKPNFNCAYENQLVPWGYYSRGRVIGHSLQGDGRLLTLGGLFVDANDRTWELRLRKGTLNRGGVSTLNTLSPVPTGLWNIEAKVDGRWGKVTYSLGVGADELSPVAAERKTIARAFLNISAPWGQ
jgi:hypothetical protein